MHLLAFDTSTADVFIALHSPQGQWHWQGAGGPESSTHLIPKILEGFSALALTPKALTAIVFGQGPGSFTGLRTACSVAQGLAFGAGVPVLPIGSLLAVAQDAYTQHGVTDVLAVLDARMGEVYHAHYRRTGEQWHAVTAEGLSAPSAVQVPAGAVVAGNTQAVYADLAPHARHLPALPTAQALLQLAPAAIAAGGLLAPEHALPLYVRDKVAQTTAERAALATARTQQAQQQPQQSPQ